MAIPKNNHGKSCMKNFRHMKVVGITSNVVLNGVIWKHALNKITVNMLLCEQIANEAKKWQEILKRILDTILFFGERC